MVSSSEPPSSMLAHVFLHIPLSPALIQRLVRKWSEVAYASSVSNNEVERET